MSKAAESIVSASDWLEINPTQSDTYHVPTEAERTSARGKRIGRISAEYQSIHESKPHDTRERRRARSAKHVSADIQQFRLEHLAKVA